MNDLLFAANGLRILRLKQMLFLLFFVVVLDKASAPVCHLIESIGQALADLIARAVWTQVIDDRIGVINLVRLLPDVVSDKALHAFQLWNL